MTMQRFIERLLGTGVLCLLCAGFVLADEPVVDYQQRSADLLNVIDVVHANHIDPPTRQEMVVQFCRELTGQTGLARKASAATKDKELRAMIVDALKSNVTRTSPDVAMQNVLMNTRLPVMISKKEDHRVNQQVAENRYVGTGIQLSMGGRNHTPIMTKVFEDGPADKVGAIDGDIIETIDGETTKGLTIVDVIKKLRGPAGSTVDVSLRQPNSAEAREYTIERGMVPIRTVEKPVFEFGDKLAYLKFTSISASAVHELRKIRAKLPEATRHLVLDFRNIHNHNLHHGRLLANALIDDALIGFVVTADDTESVRSEPGRMFEDMRLTVLINRQTGGTAEWIAAALQEHKVASIKGQPTAGAGYVTDGVEIDERIADVPVAYLKTPNKMSLLATSSRSLVPLTPAVAATLKETRARFPERVTPDDYLQNMQDLKSLLRSIR